MLNLISGICQSDSDAGPNNNVCQVHRNKISSIIQLLFVKKFQNSKCITNLKVCDYKIHHFPAGILAKFHRHYQKHHFQTTLILVISSQCEQRATSNQLHKDGRRLARF